MSMISSWSGHPLSTVGCDTFTIRYCTITTAVSCRHSNVIIWCIWNLLIYITPHRDYHCSFYLRYGSLIFIFTANAVDCCCRWHKCYTLQNKTSQVKAYRLASFTSSTPTDTSVRRVLEILFLGYWITTTAAIHNPRSIVAMAA